MTLLFLTLFPLVGALCLGLSRNVACGRAATAWSAATLVVAALLVRPGMSWSLAWLPDVGMTLRFEADGLSWLFLLLTAVVTLVAVAASWLTGRNDRGYHALVLVLQSALFGVFTARHFIPWFLCWEMTLIPAFLLIRLWGGPAAPQAAMRFFMMTLGGSVFLLVGFLALQLGAGTMDFDLLAALAGEGRLVDALEHGFAATGADGRTLLVLIAVAVLIGIAVKIPIVPFHTWLPSAYAEAPSPVTMLLTGLLSKMGVLALLRIFLPVFAEVLPVFATPLAWLAVATVILGALAALAQTDLKRMLAYSSVNHLGYCVLAVAAAGAAGSARPAMTSAMAGTVLQAINHGIIATALFLGITILEHRSRGRRHIGDFGGLRARMPVFCGCLGIAVFASLGLPGLSGFIGEFLIFNGAFSAVPAATSVCVAGLLLTAIFLLRMMRMVFWGPLKPACATWPDLTKPERALFAVLILLILLPGVWPQMLLHHANAAVLELIDLLRPIP